MALTTKGDLKAAVIAWLDRDDMAGVLDTCIELCEASIARRAEMWFDDVILEEVLGAGEASFELSEQSINPESVAFADDISDDLIQVSYERLQYWLRRNGGTTGRPRYFAFVNNTLYFAPIADTSYELLIMGEARSTPLTSDSDTNSLLINAPDIYLYGVLAETAPYLADDARVGLWAGRYEKALEELRLDKESRQWNMNTAMRRPKNPL